MTSHAMPNDIDSKKKAQVVILEDIEQQTPNYKHESLFQSKCKKIFFCNSKIYKKCLLSSNPLPDNYTVFQKIRWNFLCPPHGNIAWVFTRIIGLMTAWVCLWGISGIKESTPGGNLFSIFALYICSRLCGFLIGKIRLPSLLGMLLAGIVLNNLSGGCNIARHIDPRWKESLRDLAFICILIRAGLSLNPKGLIQLKSVVIRLALLPGVCVEGPVVAIASHYMLELPWGWAFTLGFVLAAVSPAVVVPSLLRLQGKGYGVDQEIPTLIIAAASIDDIIAISAFSIALSITFAQGGLMATILKAPIEVAAGIVTSSVCGILLWYIPPPVKNELDQHGQSVANPENHTTARFLLLFGFGISFMFGWHRVEFSGAGALGCLSVAFIAGLGWDMDTKKPVGTAFGHAWNSLMPLLFGLIGTEIDVTEIDLNSIGSGLIVISCGLVCRMLASFVAVFGTGLNLREKLFVAIAWVPKATVQAAMGSIPLDLARSTHSANMEKLGLKIITVAVLAILVSAPLGAIGISLTGSRLLQLQKQTKSGLFRRRSSIIKEDGYPRPLIPPQWETNADEQEEAEV